ncbi:ATP synthase subunit b, mitochondrial [Hypsibius exemplaris]|uniref:ATP synthase subunit b n=1 Tax=Hypsibius exemplaris TaxID=2072580 RepID=A0A9X6NIF1_HYPEX|nr:ATP synthase subunit b, mitochondrial [Hypsibius exemplaris]
MTGGAVICYRKKTISGKMATGFVKMAGFTPIWMRLSGVRAFTTSAPLRASSATAVAVNDGAKKEIQLSEEERLTALKPLMPTGEVTIHEFPERDLVNFPRPEMAVYGGRTRLGFIPEEWFDFFHKKTGVTGPYVFGVGLITTLLSKELWVVEHEFPLIPPMIFLVWLAMTKGGPVLAKVADKELDEYEEELIAIQEDSIVALQEDIKQEEKSQWMAKGQGLLFEAKREAVRLQLEAEYRRRQMEVYRDVKKRLDYQIEIQNARRSVEQRHMINWIVGNVLKSIDEKQEKRNIDQCIENLKKLSSA